MKKTFALAAVLALGVVACSPAAEEAATETAADETAVVDLWQACGLTRPWNDPHKDIARKLTTPILVMVLSNRLVANLSWLGPSYQAPSVHRLSVKGVVFAKLMR